MQTATTLRLRSATEKSSATRRRKSTRRATYTAPDRRIMNTSCGNPVPLSSYISALLNEDGSIDREKIIQSFQSYG